MKRLPWWVLVLIVVAEIVSPYAPAWLVAALVAPALVVMYIRLMQIQEEWRDMMEALDLQDLWRRQRDRT